MMFPHGYPRGSRVFDVTSMISIFSPCHPFLPPSSPSSSFFPVFHRLSLHFAFPPSPRGGEKVSSWMDDFATPCEKSRREAERERENIFSEEKEEEAEKRSVEKAIVRETGVDSSREPRRSGWTRPVRIIGSIDRISRRRSVADIHVHGSTTSGSGGSP